MSGWFQDGWWGPATGGAPAPSGSGGTGWWPRGWWTASWFAAPWWGPATGGTVVPLSPDLLAALVTYLKAAPTVTALATVYSAEAPAGGSPPYVIVDGYTEHLPGESLDDSTADGLIVLVSNNGLDTAMALGVAVKTALDSPNINPASLGRDAFIWTGGTESAVLRNDSRPRRLPGIGRGGKYVYVEEINYVFWVTPQQ